jgi:uncharacterized membrane protein YjjP (DUF1212 family)
MSATEAPRRRTAAELAEYLQDVGGTLLSYGCSTHRLEAVLREIAVLEGGRCEAFAVPTGIWMTLYGPNGDGPVARMARVKEWALNLDRLALVDRIFNDVAKGTRSLEDARRELRDIETRPPPYPALVRLLASGGAAGAAAVFFRGGLREVLVATVAGVFLGILTGRIGKSPRARLLQDFIGGAWSAALAWGAGWLFPGISREVLVLSGVILLVPGMALTTALAELAHKNLVSGGARLMEAMMVFLSILFGIAVIVQLEEVVGVSPVAAAAARSNPLLLTQGIALLVASFSFGVAFSVPPPFLLPSVLSGAVGWIVTGLGTRYLKASTGAFCAALSVCVVSNAMARVSQRPSQLFLLPGLVLLVPGSFGFLSLESFLRGEFLGGAAKGFEMFLIGGAIVTGLLVANVILPARKLL